MSSALRVVGGRAEDQRKLPPADEEAEELVCATLLWGKADAALRTFREILQPETFFRERHRQIYRHALIVADAFGGAAVDLTTISSKLIEGGHMGTVGGPEALTTLRNGHAPTLNGQRHREWAIAIHDAWRRRRAVALAQTVEAEGYLGVESTQDWLDASVRKLLWLANAGHGRAEESNSERLIRLMRAAEARRVAREADQPIEGMGAPFGLASLDKCLRGMRPGKKITICARPKLGKSALAMQSMISAARAGIGGVYYAAEPAMSLDDHMARALASVAKLDCNRIVDGFLTDRESATVARACEEISKLPIALVDARGWNVERIASDATRRSNTFRALKKAPLGVVVVDHIHEIAPLHQGPHVKKFDTVSNTTRRLASLAGELNVCVIELAQEKRGEPQRGKKPAPPTKESVSDSSDVEKSTSALLFLRKEGEVNEDGVQPMRWYLVANRDGADGIDGELEFIGPEVRFLERYRL